MNHPTEIPSSYTPAQQKAIYTLDRPLATTAGPGAGKTRVLVSRYLEILNQSGVELENIVAITFTTKAANEMRERVRKAIDVAIESNRGSMLENVWRERKRRLESGIITTIHGFCSRLLREYPIDAKVDPRFSTLDDYTATLMLNVAAEQAVTGLINAGDDAAAHLVAAYGRGNLVGALERLYTQLRGLGVGITEAYKATERSLCTSRDYNERVEETRRRVAEIAGTTGLTPKAQERVAEFLEAWERWGGPLASLPSPDFAVEYLEVLEHLRRSMPDARTKALKESVFALRAMLGHKDFGNGRLAEAYFDVCARSYMPHLFQALRSIDYLYSDAKRAAQAVDYEDLQLFARDLLADVPEVRRRAAARYRYFLVDEFQDTNRLQREIIGLLALDAEATSIESQNLFLVGDRKQSIYNFRGAEVEVFEEAIRDITARGGEHVKLDVNFRSDARLIAFFNEFFGRLMRLEAGENLEHYLALGFVGHEPGTAHRGQLNEGPAVEFLHYAKEVQESEKFYFNPWEEENLREVEAKRLAARVQRIVHDGEELVTGSDGNKRAAQYKDFAMLLGAFTQVKTYEQAFQRAGIPYYVVAGRGFYSRPEVLDLLTLLEFLDNRTDEISLAGILRSPLFGISDETLYALRWTETGSGFRVQGSGFSNPDVNPLANQAKEAQAAISETRNPKPETRNPTLLFSALLQHRKLSNIAESQHVLLDQAAETLQDLVRVRNSLPLSQLLERAIRRTQYDVIAAAAEDGPQRLSNLDKLVVLARSFEKHETRLLRDFVEYIRNFRRLEAREAEAQLEMGLDAVAILTIHKSKGLEFPIVILPDLQHGRRKYRDTFVFDREKGLGFRVPDRRGGTVETAVYAEIQDRLAVREQFEAMRQLYVGMTRAEDYLILSAASKSLRGSDKLLREQESWLHWVAGVLDAREIHDERVIQFGEALVQVKGREVELVPFRAEVEELPADLKKEAPKRAFVQNAALQARERQRNIAALQAQLEQQLAPVPAAEDVQSALHYRYSVTQLVNYLNCPRQFYFARFLQMPELELRSTGQHADDAEAREGKARLSPSLRGTIVHRFCEIFREGDDLYDTLRQSLMDVRAARNDEWSDELAAVDEDATLRDLGPLAQNYIYSNLHRKVEERWRAGENPDVLRNPARHPFVKSELSFALRTEAAMILGSVDKLLLTEARDGLHVHVIDFKTNTLWRKSSGFDAEVAEKAAMYRIQMQAYALAVWWLFPKVKQVEATLHFLHPNLEYTFPADQMTEAACQRAVVNTAKKIRQVRVMESTEFEANPGARCLNCRFAEVCPEAVRI
ncbi:MAG: UvrD-helicase domain-containing protein [Blastocatellia bacterium]|nr:UvrD-helicase domain-containing protein [Blastocatellia bacterium]